ncbi:hypothetical protein Bca101_066834 [Brassica carinata]
MATCFVLGLILTSIFLVVYFSPPELPHVTLVSLNVSKLNFTSYHNVSGYVDMQFQVLNANMLTDFCYDEFNCSMYHGERRLASTMFQGFFQRARETETINFTVYLTPVTTTAKEIRKDSAPYSFEEFDVKLATFINWGYGSSKSVSVTCNEVPVGLVLRAPGHGKMIGPARKCKVS